MNGANWKLKKKNFYIQNYIDLRHFDSILLKYKQLYGVCKTLAFNEENAKLYIFLR